VIIFLTLNTTVTSCHPDADVSYRDRKMSVFDKHRSTENAGLSKMIGWKCGQVAGQLADWSTR